MLSNEIAYSDKINNIIIVSPKEGSVIDTNEGTNYMLIIC